MRRMWRRTFVVLWSVVVWCALWSDLSVANVLWGAVVGVATTVVVPLHPEQVPSLTMRPLAVLRYVVYAAWALVKSSGIVAWEVVTPGSQLNQAIVAIPLRVQSQAVATLIANTVSLTPGTLTLEIHRDPMTLYVHIMHLRSIEHIRAEVGELEDYAMRAFPARDGGATAPAATKETS